MSGSKLFTPLQVGPNTLKHRIVMAPLTRFRSDDENVPLVPLVKEYYGQRASVPGTLLISEGVFISAKAGDYANAPGIFTDDQIAAWKQVTDEVHSKGSFIWLQLWALGRAASGAKGAEVISASDMPIEGGKPAPKPLSETEIEEYIQAYAQAAKNAVHKAGFDGVEIHGANGYLVDQFLQDVSNNRTDRWGGSIENRSRFAVQVTQAVAAAVGSNRTAIRLSPWSTFQAMKMSNPLPQFSHLLTQLKPLNLAYLHLVESRIAGNTDVNPHESESNAPLAKAWANSSPIFIAGGFKPHSAQHIVDQDPNYMNQDVAVVFGRLFIANPDLVFRIQNGLPLNDYNRDTFYNAKEAKGYVDYPFSTEFLRQSKA